MWANGKSPISYVVNIKISWHILALLMAIFLFSGKSWDSNLPLPCYSYLILFYGDDTVPYSTAKPGIARRNINLLCIPTANLHQNKFTKLSYLRMATMKTVVNIGACTLAADIHLGLKMININIILWYFHCLIEAWVWRHWVVGDNEANMCSLWDILLCWRRWRVKHNYIRWSQALVCVSPLIFSIRITPGFI